MATGKGRRKSSTAKASKASSAKRKRTAVKRTTPKGAKQKPRTKAAASDAALQRLRRICLALPATSEVEAWGEPTFRVNGKIFAMHASAATHHGQGRPAVWILCVPFEQDLVLRAKPTKYFKPPYVGPGGWIGAYLDQQPPWSEIEQLLRDAWRRRAPKRLAALLPD